MGARRNKRRGNEYLPARSRATRGVPSAREKRRLSARCTTSSSDAASTRFFEYLFDGVVRDRFAQLQLDGFIGQQAQAPPGVTFGRSGASKRGDPGALRAVNPDGSPGARLVKERSLEPFAQIAALDVEDGLERDVQDRRNRLRVLAAMQQVKDTGAGLRSSPRRSAFDDGCQRAQFVLW